jgi:hypothetical protein
VRWEMFGVGTAGGCREGPMVVQRKALEITTFVTLHSGFSRAVSRSRTAMNANV